MCGNQAFRIDRNTFNFLRHLYFTGLKRIDLGTDYLYLSQNQFNETFLHDTAIFYFLLFKYVRAVWSTSIDKSANRS